MLLAAVFLALALLSACGARAGSNKSARLRNEKKSTPSDILASFGMPSRPCVPFSNDSQSCGAIVTMRWLSCRGFYIHKRYLILK
jgi:hypothetical protein